jgi:DNA (cytosine-5)-methyltransferase 1
MFEFARWVKDLTPAFFVLENVPNFASINCGVPLRRLVREFSANGYAVSHAVLNAADYGAPTTRKRLFIVGLRGARQFVFPSKTHGDPRKHIVGDLLPWVTTADAFHSLPTPSREPPGAPEGHVLVDHTPAVRQRFRSIPPGGYDYVRKRSRLSPTEPSKSLVAGNWQGARFHIHPIEPRELTNREAARVQGIPDAFLFEGDRVAVARQIANAGPLQLGQAIAEAVGRQLRKRGKS